MSTRRKAKTQRTLWEGVIDADVRALWEPWMIEADRLLDDEDLIEVVFQAQAQRHAHSSTLGRAQTPAETVLRLLLLKHVRNWSFDTLEREVTLNLAYREFVRIGLNRVPDAKTLARIAQALGGEGIEKLHHRLAHTSDLKRRQTSNGGDRTTAQAALAGFGKRVTDHGGPCAAGGETSQGAHLRWGDATAGQDRQSV